MHQFRSLFGLNTIDSLNRRRRRRGKSIAKETKEANVSADVNVSNMNLRTLSLYLTTCSSKQHSTSIRFIDKFIASYLNKDLVGYDTFMDNKHKYKHTTRCNYLSIHR
eukprot:245810_1